MKERDSGLREIEASQIQIATELRLTSDLLSIIFPKNQSDFWHVISPQFEIPKISLLGYDLSNVLHELAGSTKELHVSQSYLEEDWDGPEHFPPTRIWEVFPPQGSSFLGSYSSDCNGRADLSGIGLTACIPDIDQPLNYEQLQHLAGDGYFSTDLMSWRRPNEGFPYRYGKPESIMMNIIGKNRAAGLEVANWFLKGLLTAKEIHPETVIFQG